MKTLQSQSVFRMGAGPEIPAVITDRQDKQGLWGNCTDDIFAQEFPLGVTKKRLGEFLRDGA